jgi:hypothetical protein
MNEFLGAYYGPAATAIRRYIDLTHDYAQQKPVHVGIYVPPTYAHLPIELLGKADRLWGDAEAHAQQLPDTLDRVRRSRMSVDYAIVEQGRAAMKTPEQKRSPEQRAAIELARRRFSPFVQTMSNSPLTRIREWKNVDKGQYRKRLATELGIE